MTAPGTRPAVSDETRAELCAAVERFRTEWEADRSDDLASHIVTCFRDWRPDKSRVGLWCMWLRYLEWDDTDALVTELIGDRS